MPTCATESPRIHSSCVQALSGLFLSPSLPLERPLLPCVRSSVLFMGATLGILVFVLVKSSNGEQILSGNQYSYPHASPASPTLATDRNLYLLTPLPEECTLKNKVTGTITEASECSQTKDPRLSVWGLCVHWSGISLEKKIKATCHSLFP